MQTPRLALVWPLIVVLFAALAGCTGSQDTADLDPLSARDALEQAQPTLEDWSQDTQLLVMSGFEGAEESPPLQRERTEAEQARFPLHADAFPGDGRAPQWVMVVLGDEQTRTLRVTSQQAVWMDEGGRQAGPGARPVGNWTIDSTEAIDRALDASDKLGSIVASEDASVFFTLAGGSQGPRWQVQANSHSLGQDTTLFVDARSGEVSNLTDAQTTSRTRSFEGVLEQGEGNATHPITVDEEGARVAVELSWNASASEDGARLAVDLLTNGTSVGDPDDAAEAPAGVQARWDDRQAGEHAVEIGAQAWGEREQVPYELEVHIG